MSVEAIEQPLAVVTDYAGLVTALRQRVIDLNTSLPAVDGVAGLPDFYTSKVLSQKRPLGPMSPGALLGALALKMAVVPDNDALARIRHRLPERGTRGPELGCTGGSRSRARKKAARELSAALARLQKPGRGRSAPHGPVSIPLGLADEGEPAKTSGGAIPNVRF